MLDFCPYESDQRDFIKIDMNNLAYGVIFMNDFSYEKLKQTIISEEYESYIIRDIKSFSQSGIQYILLPAGEDIQSGLSRLQAGIIKGNQQVQEKWKAKSTEDNKYKSSGEKWMLSCEEDPQTGCYYVNIPSEERNIMKLIPCCPNCFMPLPRGWKRADAFYPVSLIGKEDSGKTTYLLSVMADRWAKLQSGLWSVTAAHETYGETTAGVYQGIKKAADLLVKKGKCPDYIFNKEKISPIFLSVHFAEDYFLIVGLYDYPGKKLEAMSKDKSEILLLANMKAHIYFIDPEPILPYGFRHNLLSLEEQGEYQKRRNVHTVRAKELLADPDSITRNISPIIEKRKRNLLSVLNEYQELMTNLEIADRCSSQRIYLTLSKCDILKNIPEICDEYRADQYRLLFDGTKTDECGDLIPLRNDMINTLFAQHVFSDEDAAQELCNPQKLSYYCVSSLGCEMSKECDEYQLEGKYSPVRVEDPLKDCIFEIIKELQREKK